MVILLAMIGIGSFVLVRFVVLWNNTQKETVR
jgi:hypothetical protein